ncbi:hypothetical protein PCC21_007620 [Pectobacterium carotovorum subsp. carotovorum PCC21]|nr:hypothetical protein PCC21_007620 [Pectobacterium carotovorum subsp. carotovorum PCC21]
MGDFLDELALFFGYGQAGIVIKYARNG